MLRLRHVIGRSPMFVLIVVVWLGNSGHTLTMQEFTSRPNCENAAKKVIELMNQNRKSGDQLVIAESCVDK